MNKLASLAAGCLLTLFFAPSADACTTFCMQGEEGPVYGKNYDWHIGNGLLIVNPRGLTRTAEASGDPRPVKWTSLYGSVTFNQYGRDFPLGGMNEAGLVVEVMWLEGARYPDPDRRPALNNLEWVQYQLDRAASVEEVLASDAELRIRADAPLHYLVADREGAVATVEFLDGKLVAHSGSELPVPALANSTYDRSLAYLQGLEAAGKPVPQTVGSLDRFSTAAKRVASAPTQGESQRVEYAFETLAAVAHPHRTQWSIVYEQEPLRLHFRTLERPAIRSLDFASLDFSCAQPARILDLEAPVEGDIAPHLETYTTAANRRLVGESFAKTSFLSQTSAAQLDVIARLPEAAVCQR